MFDVLVYLYENYLHAGECPTEDHLVLKLSAAGFEDDDISDALAWLAELNVSTGHLPRAAQGGPATRIYTATEEVCLDTACRGLEASQRNNFRSIAADHRRTLQLELV